MQNLAKLLKKIEESNEKDGPFWIVGPESGKMFFWLVRIFQPAVIVEVGTSVAYSAIWFASALEKNQKGKIWTIESHDKRFLLAGKNIKESELGHRIVQIKGHAPEVFYDDPSLPMQIDFAFFDATKMQTASFFDAVFPRMRGGGLIIVDNVLSHRSGKMLEFIEKMYARKGLEVVEIPVGGGLMLIRV